MLWLHATYNENTKKKTSVLHLQLTNLQTIFNTIFSSNPWWIQSSCFTVFRDNLHNVEIYLLRSDDKFLSFVTDSSKAVYKVLSSNTVSCVSILMQTYPKQHNSLVSKDWPRCSRSDSRQHSLVTNTFY